MPQITESNALWDGILALLIIAVAAFVVIGVLTMTGIFNPTTALDQANKATFDQTNVDAMKRSVQSNGPAMGPALVWRRSFGVAQG
jgi:hypothetical protein